MLMASQGYAATLSWSKNPGSRCRGKTARVAPSREMQRAKRRNFCHFFQKCVSTLLANAFTGRKGTSACQATDTRPSRQPRPSHDARLVLILKRPVRPRAIVLDRGA